MHEERVPSTAYARPGFRVYEDDGRLWVFEDGSESLQGFLDKGEPAKRVTRIGVGPDDKSIMSDDAATIDEYIAAARYGRAGFHTYLVDGRLWVFREGSKEHQQFLDIGEPAKRVTRIGSGPDELSIIAPDGETIDAYMSTWQ